MSWYDTIKAMPMTQLLTLLGAEMRGKRWTCPLCNADRTGKDKRPPLTVRGGDQLFYCNACQASGNSFDMVAHKAQNKSAAQCDWKDLAKWVQINIDKSVANNGPQMYSPRVVEPPKYPPQQEVEQLLKCCVRIGAVGQNELRPRDIYTVFEWLEQRCIEPSKAPAMWLKPKADISWMTEVVSSSGTVTTWWPQAWLRQFPLVMPLYDGKGIPRSILGRAWTKRVHRKTTVPISFSTQNLFLANKLARSFMQNNSCPDTIWIVEGEIDYICASQEGLCVIGIRSGSIDGLAMLPWRAHQKVMIATDNDTAGDRYANDISLLISPAKPLRIKFDEQ